MLNKIQHKLHKFASGYYNLLLIFLTALFILRPYDRGDIYLAIWKLILTGTLLTAIFNSHTSRPVKMITFILAVPSILLSWVDFSDQLEIAFIINSICTLLFITITTIAILYDVVLRARVTLETLRGAICAYFMIAFFFAYLFYLIEVLFPGSFYFAQKAIIGSSYTHFLSEMLYFSFVTLLTIGYGDVVAVHNVAQTAAVLEGIVGQFYVAILVARLVSVYTFYGDKELLKEFEKKVHHRSL